MPRKLNGKMTLDTLESEVMFTLAMLRADPNASDLESYAAAWTGRVGQLRTSEQDFRQQEADADAARIVGNQYLDVSCRRFGTDLFAAVDRNTYSSRWLKFYTTTVTDFLRQSLARQVSLVQSWLSSTTDEVLEKYRTELENWSTRCSAALSSTDGVTVKRRDVWAAREQLAADLTRERDALHRKLAERADERGLSRGWADLFFRTESHGSSGASSEGTTDGQTEE